MDPRLREGRGNALTPYPGHACNLPLGQRPIPSYPGPEVFNAVCTIEMLTNSANNNLTMPFGSPERKETHWETQVYVFNCGAPYIEALAPNDLIYHATRRIIQNRERYITADPNLETCHRMFNAMTNIRDGLPVLVPVAPACVTTTPFIPRQPQVSPHPLLVQFLWLCFYSGQHLEPRALECERCSLHGISPFRIDPDRFQPPRNSPAAATRGVGSHPYANTPHHNFGINSVSSGALSGGVALSIHRPATERLASSLLQPSSDEEMPSAPPASANSDSQPSLMPVLSSLDDPAPGELTRKSASALTDPAELSRTEMGVGMDVTTVSGLASAALGSVFGSANVMPVVVGPSFLATTQSTGSTPPATVPNVFSTLQPAIPGRSVFPLPRTVTVFNTGTVSTNSGTLGRGTRVAAAAAAEREAAARQQEELAQAQQMSRPPTPPQGESDGRPVRWIRWTQRWLAAFPEPPPPAPAPNPDPEPLPDPEHPPEQHQPPPRRWIVTKPNGFGVYKVYPRQPTHDPDRKRTTADLCRTSELAEDAPKDTTPWFHPFDNATHALIMEYSLLILKDSVAGTNTFLDFMRDPVAGEFRQDEIGHFKVKHGHAILDKLAQSPPGTLNASWNTGSVVLRVPPSRRSKKPILEIPITGILYRRPVDIVREAFTTAAFERLHTTPFSLRAGPIPKPGQQSPYDAPNIETNKFGLPPLPRGHQELHGEMYNAARTMRAFQNLPECEEEPVVVSLMPFSDGTHLAQFGDGCYAAWLLVSWQPVQIRPRQALLERALSYGLPDNLEELYVQHYEERMPDHLLAFLKRELFHLVWELMLDDDFVEAWDHGMRVDECWDHLRRCLFLRFPTYGADYMDKILAITMKFLAKRPCPRCRILKIDIPNTGKDHDLTKRKDLRKNTVAWRGNVETARRKIFERGAAVNGDQVNDILAGDSYVPNTVNVYVYLSDPESDSETNFNLFEMFVPDLLHEVELGVFKSVLIHLIRVLYALDKTKVVQFDARFRDIPSFGRMTIRKFTGNVSEMKKLAARDFEDILQCLLPVCEDLARVRKTTSPHNGQRRALPQGNKGSLRKHLQVFARDTKSVDTYELPHEQAARARAAAAKATQRAASGKPAAPAQTTCRAKPLNLETYKYHCLPDYPDAIIEIGTTDSYSTSISELAHRKLKRMYGKTNKRNFEKQIAAEEQRVRFMRRILERKKRLALEANKARIGDNTTAHEQPEQKRPKLSRRARLRATLRQKTALRRYIAANKHHYISDSTRNYIRLCDFGRRSGRAAAHAQDDSDEEEDDEEDPAFRDMVYNLRVYTRRWCENTLKPAAADQPEERDYTSDELLAIHFDRERVWTHSTLQVNYTTYDLQRDQDTINTRTRPNIMFLSTDEEDRHPYQYAEVIAIGHARVKIPAMPTHKRMEFLYVRFYERVRSHRCIPEAERMPKLRYADYKAGDAFGFIDPDNIIRGVHIVPAFASGQTKDLLPPLDIRPPSANDEDWRFYYVNGFVLLVHDRYRMLKINSVVDRDMFMRYQHDAIGHRHAWAGATHSLGPEASEVEEEEGETDADVDGDADGRVNEERAGDDNEGRTDDDEDNQHGRI
ncbi:hypothetical protein MKEN_00602400 [Mycena kentingensis (nom. inval.)]|nr:hypothetical protein MKEN_00602400 [Mycena kentingensis (nom. inval.)]